jgi:hypothetical protein
MIPVYEIVMVGLVPTIHVFFASARLTAKEGVDARDKREHDDGV